MKFAALDFETANTTDASICAAAVATFEDGELKESLYWLVRPPKGYGFFRPDFTENCHGLTWFDVQNSPEFPAIAPELLTRLTAADVMIAHNADFDVQKLKGTLQHFSLECPAFDYLCTCRLARRIWPNLENHQLDTVAAHIGHKFNHHHAKDDAEAAGRVLSAMMTFSKAESPKRLAEVMRVEAKRF